MTSSRSAEMLPEEVQVGSRDWWTTNPMSYDWKGTVNARPLSIEWFNEIDQRFLHGARLFSNPSSPFDEFIPRDLLRGKNVVEIGCGMGFHTELLCRAGAAVTALDLTSTAVEATKKRLALKGLRADVHQCDAEKMPMADSSVDFVWSWGVIHHSSRTGRIVREIARVLKPAGEARIMVYNREGTAAKVVFWRDHVFRLGFIRRSFEETLYRATDGFSARYYVPEQFEDLFRTFFDNVSSEVCGQDADVVPLPARIRRPVLALLPREYQRRSQGKRGAFLFLRASGKV